MNPDKLEQILKLIGTFAESDSRIIAVGLCGSHARGDARVDSDIDLSILVEDKLKFKNVSWINNFEFDKINENLDFFEDKKYGRVWSRHVFLKSGIEIEFSFANLSWADTKNLDNGTLKVVSDGFKIIYDPRSILNKLVEKVTIVSE